MGTNPLPPSPVVAKQRPSWVGAHLFALLAAHNAYRAALKPDLDWESNENRDFSAESSQSAVSYWDDLAAVKEEKEEEIRTSLGLSKRDTESLMKEWLRINGELSAGTPGP